MQHYEGMSTATQAAVQLCGALIHAAVLMQRQVLQASSEHSRCGVINATHATPAVSAASQQSVWPPPSATMTQQQ